MSGEESVMERKLEHMRVEVNRRFDVVHGDLKELTQALREMIRLDGDLKRQNDALVRVGRQVDAHEERLHDIEVNRLPQIEGRNTETQTTAKQNSRFVWLLITAGASVFSGGLVGLVVYGLTH